MCNYAGELGSSSISKHNRSWKHRMSRRKPASAARHNDIMIPDRSHCSWPTVYSDIVLVEGLPVWNLCEHLDGLLQSQLLPGMRRWAKSCLIQHVSCALCTVHPASPAWVCHDRAGLYSHLHNQSLLWHAQVQDAAGMISSLAKMWHVVTSRSHLLPLPSLPQHRRTKAQLPPTCWVKACL